MPVEVVDTLITDLDPPLFAVKVDQGSVTLDGFVPSQAVIELLAGGAQAVYGPDQVTNNLTVDDSTYSSFWMQTMPGVFQLFQAFPAYQFTVEEGAFSGAIQGGVNFATDSTEISPQAAQALDIGVAVLARDISIGMLVTGHTDSQGPDDYNQALSEARAQSVVDYFVASGIDPARLIAAGAGESQPVADNETDEGRAQNRRVEFVFGPASALGG
ncbi:MAG: OmpA family protein [Acidimicrobiia bacterium]|nr:OmpA family protein [Acidimicrobiia bacterium]